MRMCSDCKEKERAWTFANSITHCEYEWCDNYIPYLKRTVEIQPKPTQKLSQSEPEVLTRRVLISKRLTQQQIDKYLTTAPTTKSLKELWLEHREEFRKNNIKKRL